MNICVPKSVPCLVLDKVRQELISENLNSNVLAPNVPNKSFSQELNNVYFVDLGEGWIQKSALKRRLNNM